MRIVNDDCPAKGIPHLPRAVASDRAARPRSIDNPALICSEFVLGVAVIPKVWRVKYLSIRLMLHDRAGFPSVCSGKALRIAGMDEFAVWPVSHAPRNEILDRDFRLAGPWRNVDDQPLAVSDDDTL